MRLLTLFLLSFASNIVVAQKDAEPSFMLNITYAAHLMGGDIQEDFSPMLNVGLGLQYITKKRWIFGLEGNVMFGGNLKQDVLANMRTAEGEIVNGDQTFAIVFLEGRGFYIGALGGKVFPVTEKYPNSGIRISTSIGMLQHKIRIEDRTGGLPQLSGDYLKGYDRLTYGLAFTEFIGYQHVSKNNLLKVMAGFELTQGFTKNRRSWDFATAQRLDQARLDLLNGFRIGWILTFGGGGGYDADDIFY